jgi:type II secretory ATPase GspE/PulE/Tfp pilus assembly ATPase PilB-like protein
LATLHTNSAAGALPRLLDMGIEPFLLASTINIVVAQRLVRKLCDDSKQLYQAEPHMVEQFHHVLDGLKIRNSDFQPGSQNLSLYKPMPSPKCDESGYSGRIGIFEAMPISDNIAKLVMKGASAGLIEQQAVSEGMITMAQDGYLKAMEGVTTIEEVLRVQSN